MIIFYLTVASCGILVQYLYHDIEHLYKDKKLLASDISITVVMLEGLGGF